MHDGPEDGVRSLIVVGASAGGLEGLQRLAAGLPPDLPAAVCVVMHILPNIRSLLPELLSRAGPLPADHAQNGERVRPWRIYVAPPDRHLLIERYEGGMTYLRLSAGPRENHSRPAADPLFRSAALAFGRSAVGVVLSGSLSDGTAGLWEIKQRGGVAVVQDPGEAAYPSMPHSAVEQVPVDFVLPVAEMPALLARLAQERAGGPEAIPETITKAGAGSEAREVGMAPMDEKPGSVQVDRDTAGQVSGERNGTVTVYVCPDCGGTLWQVNAGPFLRFRCHVGHVYSGDDLLEGYTSDMERALWYVVRSLRDKANLTRQLAHEASTRGDTARADDYEEKARSDDEHSAAIERMIAATTSVNRRGT